MVAREGILFRVGETWACLSADKRIQQQVRQQEREGTCSGAKSTRLQEK